MQETGVLKLGHLSISSWPALKRSGWRKAEVGPELRFGNANAMTGARVERATSTQKLGGIAEMKHLLRKLWRDDDGQDMVEYALIAGLISVAAYLSVVAVGGSIQTIWTNVSNAMTAAAG